MTSTTTTTTVAVAGSAACVASPASLSTIHYPLSATIYSYHQQSEVTGCRLVRAALGIDNWSFYLKPLLILLLVTAVAFLTCVQSFYLSLLVMLDDPGEFALLCYALLRFLFSIQLARSNQTQDSLVNFSDENWIQTKLSRRRRRYLDPNA